MKPALFISFLLIALPLRLAAQTDVVLQKNNVSGAAGSVQTFLFTVTYDTLAITINASPSGAGGSGTVKFGPADSDLSNTTPISGDSASFTGVPGGVYKAVVTGGSYFYGLDISVTESGPTKIPSFFIDEKALSGNVQYLSFPNGNYFGYFAFLPNPAYIYHFDLGYEYVFDAADGNSGIYLYDFASRGFFYTSPNFPFPYMYDFALNSVVYYYPDPNNSGRYNTDGIRYFYVFNTGEIISK